MSHPDPSHDPENVREADSKFAPRKKHPSFRSATKKAMKKSLEGNTGRRLSKKEQAEKTKDWPKMTLKGEAKKKWMSDFMKD